MADEVTPGTKRDGPATGAGALPRLTVREMVRAGIRHTAVAKSRLGAEARETKPALVLVVTAAYSLLLLPLVGVIGSWAAIFPALPVVLARWLAGLRGGVLVEILAPSVHELYVRVVSEESWYEGMRQSGGLGSEAHFLVGAAIGGRHELR